MNIDINRHDIKDDEKLSLPFWTIDKNGFIRYFCSDEEDMIKCYIFDGITISDLLYDNLIEVLEDFRDEEKIIDPKITFDIYSKEG